MGIVPPMISNIVVLKKENSTKEKLVNIGKSFLLYYDKYGSYPTNLDSLNEESIVNNPSQDTWDKDLAYYTDVFINGVKYPAVFISGGKDGNIDSSKSGSNVTLSDNDLYYLVSQGMRDLTNRGKTNPVLSRANSAYDLYMADSSTDKTNCSSAGNTHCVEDLIEADYLTPNDGYDKWGHILVVNSSANGMKSCGYDGVCNNSDDIN